MLQSSLQFLCIFCKIEPASVGESKILYDRRRGVNTADLTPFRRSQMATFVHGLVTTLVVYYLPTYFQGAHGTSAIRSGILIFPTACVIGKTL